jgi:hypothetical protein
MTLQKFQHAREDVGAGLGVGASANRFLNGAGLR